MADLKRLGKTVKIDPVVVSISALVVSIVSLVLTTRRAAVDRRLQWEQLRGRTHSRLTARGVELLTWIEEVRRVKPADSLSLTRKLIRISEGVIAMRKSLARMRYSSGLLSSTALTEMTPIVSDLDDADPIFEMLSVAVKKPDIVAAEVVADGLLRRFYGSEEEPNK
ncbi:MAG: hypothetical protein HZA93_24270 [Verrucomicrobia bacterium]|nr:hypothetical protein [Verrucomicrobiota bacterium]